MARVRLENVCKVYGSGSRSVKAVTDFSLDIRDKEFIVFVGPSGCGKSTTLRMIAGLESITSGNLFIGDRYCNDLEPKDRNIAMVFQNYALYPHLSVYENLAYPLRCHHMSKEDIESRVKEASDILGIRDYLGRKPKELSGGQRQRVALGRAIVRHPDAFLLDEPLSNLDAKLRVQMRAEISRLHQKLGTTFIYVTHDQTEAMTMGDRIVVMKDGVIQQVDSPSNLYDHPCNVFVATFLGSPQMNILEGKITKEEGKTRFVSLGEKPFSFAMNPLQLGHLGEEDFPLDVKLGIRPSDVLLGCEEEETLFRSTVELVERLGDQTLVYFYAPGRKDYSIASTSGEKRYSVGEKIQVGIKKEKAHFFNGKTDVSLSDVKPVTYLSKEKVHYLDGKQKGKLADRLIDASLAPLVPSALIQIPSSAIRFEKTDEDDVAIQVVCDCSKDYSDRIAVYAHVKDSNKGISFSSEKDRKPGEEITLYVPLSQVDLVDPKTMEKITDTEKLSSKCHPGVLSFRKQGCFLEAKDEIENHEKAYTLVRLNPLGKKDLLVLKGVKTGEVLYYSVDSSDLLYVSMNVFFRKRCKTVRK